MIHAVILKEKEKNLSLFSHRIENITGLKYDVEELLSYIDDSGDYTKFWVSRYSFGDAFLLHPIVWNNNWEQLELYPGLYNIVRQFKDYKATIKYVDFARNAPNTRMPPHIDGGRLCALNIPLTSNTGAGFDVYEDPNYEGVKDAIDSIIFDKKRVQCLASVSYYNPVLINTAVPHGARNPTGTPRIIATIGFGPEYTFRRIRELYKNGGLLL